MAQIFANNARSTLAVAVSTTGQTLIEVQPGEGVRFPSPSDGDYAILTLTQAGIDETLWEEVTLTSRTLDVLTVVRGAEDSTQSLWVEGDKVELRITAQFLNTTGYRNIQQNIQAYGGYTCTLADSGKQILHPSVDTTARAWVIPSNASVPYDIGTALTFINQFGAGVITLSVATDTMRVVGTALSGTRTLAANSMATAVKITATEWLLSGVGIT